MYDKWHHPPAACWGKDFIITRSPFIAPAISFQFEDEEVYEQERTGTHRASYLRSAPGRRRPDSSSIYSIVCLALGIIILGRKRSALYSPYCALYAHSPGGGDVRNSSNSAWISVGDMEEERPRSSTVTTTSSSYSEAFSSSASLSYDRTFLRSAPGALLLAEIVFGLLVWALIAGSEYFLFPSFGWVMFVAVFYWVLTAFLFIIYVTRAHTRISKVPWTLVGLCFHGSAFVLYLTAAIVDATSITKDFHWHHNYNSWTASAFFAFLATICYGASTYFSFQSWRTRS